MEEIIFIQSFIHSCLLSTYYIPGPVPQITWNIQMSVPHPLTSKSLKYWEQGEEQNNMFIKINITQNMKTKTELKIQLCFAIKAILQVNYLYFLLRAASDFFLRFTLGFS